MPQQLFDWLNSTRPPAQFREYPEAGDLQSEGDMVAPVPPAPVGNLPESPPDTQIETSDLVHRQFAPSPNVRGNESVVDSWDQAYEIVPQYDVPAELGGGIYTGDLKWAPSLPQDLQPARFVKVPRNDRMM